MSKQGQSDTRDLILKHAETLIRTRGYAGFSYADLSDLVKIRKPSIHYHFPTKEQLVIATLEVYCQRYKEAFVQICAQHSNALDRIDAYSRIYLEGLDQGVGCLCAALAVERDILPQRLRAALADFFRGHLEWLQSVYADGLKNGEVSAGRDPAAAAQLVLSALEGSLLVARALDQPGGMNSVHASLRHMFQPSADF